MVSARGLVLVWFWMSLGACATGTLDPSASDPLESSGGSSSVRPSVLPGASGGASVPQVLPMATSSGGSSGAAGGPTAGAAGAQAGAGGRVGAGAGGNQGSSGSAAGGTSASPFVPGECAASPNMRVRYRQKGQGKQIIVELELLNQSGAAIALDQLAVRYFFSDEEASGWVVFIYDVKVVSPFRDYTSKGSSRLTALDSPLAGADAVLELGIDSPDALPVGAAAFMSLELQPKDYADPSQQQSNDFSFGAGHASMTDWDRIALYVGDNLVWGCLPSES